MLSFNGNKIITTGAGGAVLTNNKNYALDKSLVEQAKVRHTYKFNYASVGYNLKMPGLNASLKAQIKKIKVLVSAKRRLFKAYQEIFKNNNLFRLRSEPKNCKVLLVK